MPPGRRLQTYPMGEAQAAPLPGPQQSGASGDFGQFQARQLDSAGQQLERGAVGFGNASMILQREMDETRVEDEVNGFISAKQNALYTAPDAFYRLKGAEAINGAQAATDKLLSLKTEAIGRAANPEQRRMLMRRLDGQMTEATEGMSRHVAQQATEWQKNTLAARSTLLQSETANDSANLDNVYSKAAAAESVGIERARLLYGAAPDSDIAKVEAAKESSTIFKTAIQTQLDKGNKRAALSLYETVKDKLGIKDDHTLSTAMKSVAAEVKGEQVVGESLARLGLPGAGSSDGGSIDNNIGNITKSPYQYAGGKGEPQGSFETFKTPEQGVAAAYQTIKAKADQNGGRLSFLDLIAGNGKVRGWAPADDGKTPLLKGNNPAAYAASLAKSVDLNPNDPIPLGDDAKMATILRAMNLTEKGKQTVSDNAYAGGIQLAKGEVQPPGSYKGDLKAGYEQAAYDINQRTDLNADEKKAALALLGKTQTQITSYQTAAIKSLRDEHNTTLATMFVSPDQVKPGTLAKFADRAAGLGEQELATRYRLIASMEGTIRNGLAVAPPEQLKMLHELAEGLPKQLIAGLQSGNSDALTAAADSFAKLKQAQTDGLDPAGLAKMAKATVDLYTQAGRTEKAREVQQWYANASTARDVQRLPETAQKQAMNELEQSIAKGEGDQKNVELYDLMKKGYQQQAEAFKRDSLAASASLYTDMGPLPPISDIAGRADYARRASARRGVDVLPFTEPEIAAIRKQLEGADPQGQAKLMSTLATLPADMVPHVAAALAGKGETSDQLSRSYAAALSFFGERTPEAMQTASQILAGAKIIKEGGNANRKPAETSDAWQQALQDRMGGVFRDLDPKLRAVIADAAASVYVYQMDKAGRTGEKLDGDILDAAIKAVVGETIAFNGQKILPPARGATAYDVDRAMRSLSDGDLAGLKTTEGDPITADVVRRKGILTNAGQEGVYFVRVPDPRAGMDPRPVVRPDGREFRLDMRPLMERSKLFPDSLAPSLGDNAARRQAPSSPTAGLDPVGR